ncbi:hypothetical protein D3C73_1106730 [compost metagenome]
MRRPHANDQRFDYAAFRACCRIGGRPVQRQSGYAGLDNTALCRTGIDRCLEYRKVQKARNKHRQKTGNPQAQATPENGGAAGGFPVSGHQPRTLQVDPLHHLEVNGFSALGADLHPGLLHKLTALLPQSPFGRTVRTTRDMPLQLYPLRISGGSVPQKRNGILRFPTVHWPYTLSACSSASGS